MRSALSCVSLIVFILLTNHQAFAQTTPTVLRPGTPVERSIKGSESHTYTINLNDEEYLQFAVVQRGVDLIVRVTSPLGKNLGDYDTPNGGDGPENVAIVSVVGGAYQITVTPLDPKSDSGGGTYEIKTLEIRPATEQELKIAKSEEARRLKGLALLSDLVASLPEIRLPQTRIRVKFKAAVLLWNSDQKKALKLFTEGVVDIKDYLNTLGTEDETYEVVYFSLQQLRLEAVQLVALSDPEAALELFRSSRLQPKERTQYQSEQQQEEHFELTLATQIAARNPKRAYELAQESLKNGFSTSLVGTLQRLSQEDAELAADLGKSITAKLLEEKLSNSAEGGELAMDLVRRSDPSPNTTSRPGPPLLGPTEFKSLLQKLVNEALSTKPNPNDLRNNFWSVGILTSLSSLFGDQLDSYVPGASAAIEAKLKESSDQPGRIWQKFESRIQRAESPELTKETLAKAPPEMRGQLVQQLVQRRIEQSDLTEARQLILENFSDPRSRRQALSNLEREAALKDLQNGRIEDALKHVSNIEPLAARAQLISEMASRLGSGQKRGQALNYLETARSMLGTSIKADGLPQMSALLNLARAFSRYDARRAFEIVDPLIDQFNELGQATKTLSGFGPQYFFDGELSLNNGNPMAELTTSVGETLGILSFADFDRAKLTADRLVLPEVRAAVSLEIAQQAIAPIGIYSPSAAYLNSRNR
jgi:hypothetical protein